MKMAPFYCSYYVFSTISRRQIQMSSVSLFHFMSKKIFSYYIPYCYCRMDNSVASSYSKSVLTSSMGSPY